jgi:predicted HD phosphohydrolase
MEPFKTTDEAWAALAEQRGMCDGEAVDLWQHQLQTAAELERRGADPELIVAGLLHDLGDGRVSEAAHAPWAAALVRPLLGDRVAEAIALHADAKRYLCTVDRAYWDTLSPTSRRTMEGQGGLMTPEELARFEANPHHRDAILLRECDDAGKDPSRAIEDPGRYRALLDRVAAARAAHRPA